MLPDKICTTIIPDLFFSVFLIEEALFVEWAKTTMGRM